MKLELPLVPPLDIRPAWPGQFQVFSWYNFVINVPGAVFVVTTLKENGRVNAQLNAWGMMMGSGEEPKFILQVMKQSDTFRLIKKEREFVISYPSLELKQQFMKTIQHYDAATDELEASGLTAEPSARVSVPRVKECFAHLECRLDWMKDLEEGTKVNALIQGSIVHAAIDQSVLTDDLAESYEKRGFVYDIQEMINPVTKVSQSNGVFAKLNLGKSVPIE